MKTSWRRFQDVFKTSWSRQIYSPNSYVFRRRLQDVLIKTNIIVLVIRLQDIFKTFCKDLFKTFSKRIIRLKCSCYHVFKMTRIQRVSETYCKDGYLYKDLPRSHFWEIYGQCTNFARVIKVSQILVSYLTTPFRDRLQRGI